MSHLSAAAASSTLRVAPWRVSAASALLLLLSPRTTCAYASLTLAASDSCKRALFRGILRMCGFALHNRSRRVTPAYLSTSPDLVRAQLRTLRRAARCRPRARPVRSAAAACCALCAAEMLLVVMVMATSNAHQPRGRQTASVGRSCTHEQVARAVNRVDGNPAYAQPLTPSTRHHQTILI